MKHLRILILTLSILLLAGKAYSADPWSKLEIWNEVAFEVINAGDVAYFSQPMLVFGSSIGEGNYQPIPNEVIPLQSPFDLTNYSNASVSASTAINLEAESSGKIGKGIKGIQANLLGTNAAANNNFELKDKSGGSRIVSLYTQVNAVPTQGTGFGPCNIDGDIYIYRVSTWTAVYITIQAIQT